MNYPEKPYEGQSPFIFFGYCHEDAEYVYPIIDRLQSAGFRVWYDDPRQQVKKRLEVTNDHIRSAAVCIAAVSINFARTHSSIQGLTLMVTENKPLLPIILDKEKYPKGLCLQLAKYSCIPWSDSSSKENFFHKLLADSLYGKCREAVAGTSPLQPGVWKAIYENKKPSANSKRTVVDNGDDERTVVDNSDDEKTVVDNGDDERTVVDNGDDERTVVDNGDDERTVVDNGDGERTVIIQPKIPLAHIVCLRTGELYDLYNIETTLGRSAQHAEIVFHDNDGTISRHHADILYQEGQFFLKDCGSSNKTYINYIDTKKEQKELEANVAYPLKDIALFSLANEAFLFIAAREKSFVGAKERGCACFLIAERTDEWKLLTDEELFLDRCHPWNDGVLGSKHIHRENEAKLIFHDGCYRLINIDSANGISVDRKNLPKGSDVVLKDNSRIQFKDESFVYKEILINRKVSK